MIIDTHAHIYSENYKDIEQIIQNAKNKMVNKIINCAENLESSKEIMSLAKIYNDVFLVAIGIHPEYASIITKQEINELEKLINECNLVAIGEIGLDYHYGKENREQQLKLFNEQLELAVKYKLPVIIHSRDATLDTISTLKKYNLKGIIHCFSGSYEVAKEYNKLGYILGIGGVVTFKNSKLIDELKKIDVQNLCFETDSPFLTPEPYRKYKNEPKYVTETIKYVSEKLEIPYNKLVSISNQNIARIFDKNF